MVFVISLFLLISFYPHKIIKKNLIEYNGNIVEKEMIPAIKVFEKRCNKKISTNLYFSNTMPGPYVIGYCWIALPRSIYINKIWWEVSDQNARELLILHELGHCELFKFHNEKWIQDANDFYPKSIMHPLLFPKSYFLHKEYYLKEFCN